MTEAAVVTPEARVASGAAARLDRVLTLLTEPIAAMLLVV